MGCCASTPEPPSITVIGKDSSGNTIATVEAETYYSVGTLKSMIESRLRLNRDELYIDITYEGNLLRNPDALGKVLRCNEPTSPPVVLITTMPVPGRIPHGVELPEKKPPGGSGGMWSGIAESGGRLFLAPHDADCVLVIDPAAGTTSTISIGVEGRAKWSGIAACAGRLYCAPYDAGEVLVIDPSTNTTSTIECSRTFCDFGRQGDVIREQSRKWSGAVASGGRVYCAPVLSGFHEVLVIDPSTDTCSTIPIVSESGRRWIKWARIAECGGRLLCPPEDTSLESHELAAGHEMLSIDPATQTARTRPVRGLPERVKFGGIAAFDGRLFCVSDRKIVAIDPATGDASTIAELNSGDNDVWQGVTEFGGRLYCPPCVGREVLVIDPVAGTTSKIPLGATWGYGLSSGLSKWSSAASCGGRLYFNPDYEADVLVITPPAVPTD